MTLLSKLYYRIFKRYRRLEYKFCTYKEADDLIRANQGKPESEQWDIAREEDNNNFYGLVHIERKERITE